MSPSRWLALALLALSLVIAPRVYAITPWPPPGTLVTSDIMTDTVWTPAGSPYQLLGHIVVEPGVTLTIEPGVQVSAWGQTELEIEGTLIATGTAAEPITFAANPAIWAGRFSWLGILFGAHAAPATTMAYVTIRDAQVAVNGYPGAQLTHVVFEGDNTGLQGTTPVAVSYALFKDDGFGLWAERGWSIVHSTFTGNAVAVTGYADQPGIHINDNNFSGNIDRTVVDASPNAGPPCASCTIDATHDWWGTLSPGVIVKSFGGCPPFDKGQCIKYLPFLLRPDASAPR